MPNAEKARPSPDALLKLAEKQQRGRLKLFLGAAPGVGKTYEMLLEAHARKREHVDVVIGVVEHHGRSETQNLIGGLEIIPRRQISYRGQTLKEMDLDAILKRKPKLVLVDEMAHTNVDGSRHPKRWMDVHELLGAGIDVFSTMNVQHLESANDIVAKITRVQVQETVPDSVLSLADEIEVVDITAEELQQRLREGKVYPQEVAQRALANFFSEGNLTALRELALRRAAERVDEAMRAHMAAQGIEGPWEASDRVLACIDATPAAQVVVRRAKRLADRLRAPWEAVHVETPDSVRTPQRDQSALLETFRLAEELGAKTRSLNGGEPIDEILSYARDQNITHIVVGAAARPLWIELFRGSMIRRLVRGAGDIAIEIAPREERKASAVVAEALRVPPLGEPGAYVAATMLVALATAFAVLIDQAIRLPNISLVFVLAVIAAAIRYGVAVSVFTAAIASLAYNFFLTQPYYTFQIAEPANVWAVIFFLAVGLAVSGLAARTRAQAIIARKQARQSGDLEAFARGLVGLEQENEIAQSTAETAAKLLFARVVVLSHRQGELQPIAEAPGAELLLDDDMAAAQWAFAHRREAGRGSDTLHGARWLFLPVPGERGFVGVIGVHPQDDAARLSPEQRRILDLIAVQAGVALDRCRFQREAADARVEAESERLKGTLLSSVSHDLRTPLSTIRGALESLQKFGDRHDPATRTQLLDTAVTEARKLSRFIENLLDMTRIDAGVVRMRKDPLEVATLVENALDRAQATLKTKTISRDVSTGLPRIVVDPALAETALANVLENAGKYAPDGSTVLVRAYRKDQAVEIEVLDEGPGFDAESAPHLFEKFARGVEGDGRPPGTGLGLAIAKGFVEAQGGAIEARNRSDKPGAVVSLRFPTEVA
ncbi:MAG TPA: sensor histidine kinase KdpD [Vitreimonas sp.]|jgi:two-component system sensor histidine kinase KdpD|nr:sensor histidine kinase KdpD [Vitreimonas sp.]